MSETGTQPTLGGRRTKPNAASLKLPIRQRFGIYFLCLLSCTFTGQQSASLLAKSTSQALKAAHLSRSPKKILSTSNSSASSKLNGGSEKNVTTSLSC